jgi:hypothetical protein
MPQQIKKKKLHLSLKCLRTLIKPIWTQHPRKKLIKSIVDLLTKKLIFQKIKQKNVKTASCKNFYRFDLASID